MPLTLERKVLKAKFETYVQMFQNLLIQIQADFNQHLPESDPERLVLQHKSTIIQESINELQSKIDALNQNTSCQPT